MDTVTIGQRIKAVRKERGLTQQELADRIGKTESSIRKYEKGLVEIPMSVLNQISKVFGISTTELLISKEELLNKWNSRIDNDRLSKEVKLLELLKELYPNDYDFIVDLFTRLGLLETETGKDETI